VTQLNIIQQSAEHRWQ